MAAIVLGKKPETFKPITVDVTLPTGDVGQIDVTFNYRTRSEFCVLMDKKIEMSEGTGNFAEHGQRLTEADTYFMKEAIHSWGLDQPLNDATIKQLCDEVPGVSIAMTLAYRNACTSGHLGN